MCDLLRIDGRVIEVVRLVLFGVVLRQNSNEVLESIEVEHVTTSSYQDIGDLSSSY